MRGLTSEGGQGWPQCCDAPMLDLRKAHAEAATKLTCDERLEWVRRGMRVFRRAGRRWTAALSPTQLARSRDQVDAFKRRYPSVSVTALKADGT